MSAAYELVTDGFATIAATANELANISAQIRDALIPQAAEDEDPANEQGGHGRGDDQSDVEDVCGWLGA